MAELLSTLSTTSLILAVVFFAIAVLLFFLFDIRSVVSELTGKTANAEIAKIRERGTTRKYKGKTLQSIVLDSASSGGAASTNFSLDKIDLESNEDADEETVLQASEAATSMLGDSFAQEESEQETTFLGSTESSEQETTLLGSGESNESSEQATTLLNEERAQ